MTITINQNNIDFTLENEKTIGEILSALETVCEENEGTIVQINANKKTILASEIEEFSQKSIDSINELDIEAIFLKDVKNALKEIELNLKDLIPQLEELPVLLQSGKDSQVSSVLRKFADTFDGICRIITAAALFPEFLGTLTIEGTSVTDFLKEFSPLLSDFENAIKENDTVLTGDLAEYEIKPRLELFYNTIRSV